jgi:CheY-like chemotaxis protein
MVGRPLAVVLVEDNPDHAELVMRSLAEHQAAVTLFTDGTEALEHLGAAGTDGRRLPDVILLDLRLARIDGIDVLAAIRADSRLAGIPVVVLTASESPRDLVRAYGLYANSYLVKPVGADRFRRMLDDVGRYWSTRNRTLAAPGPR